MEKARKAILYLTPFDVFKTWLWVAASEGKMVLPPLSFTFDI